MNTVYQGKATCVSPFQVGVGVARAMDFTDAALVHRDLVVPYLAHRIASALTLLAARFNHLRNRVRRRGAGEMGVVSPGFESYLR